MAASYLALLEGLQILLYVTHQITRINILYPYWKTESTVI